MDINSKVIRRVLKGLKTFFWSFFTFTVQMVITHLKKSFVLNDWRSISEVLMCTFS